MKHRFTRQDLLALVIAAFIGGLCLGWLGRGTRTPVVRCQAGASSIGPYTLGGPTPKATVTRYPKGCKP